ncbi:amidoligase enzyme [Pseudomonas phage Bjorn]|uniref:Uncharacterized protein n=1 Tax=Pseudomonas phage Bjorn TaxID=2079288 RepID=A0A2K9VHH6_9CAUD|nr:amidoligase enzyme [Pseudomonas phage Bjorn]AUV61794.1 hypothetical protein PsPhBjorn_gp22 [Pseudomonas phage Bjorn]
MELELEGFSSTAMDVLNRHIHPLWRLTNDGSLRNGGIELITNGGFGGQRLFEAFERLAAGLERVNYDASFRCSTHMHINMLDFTVNQVARFLLVYTACEPILFEFCGAYRKSSNFCTPVTESLPFHRKLINRLWDDSVRLRIASGQTSKYTALNLAPLFPSDRSPALGTVEFRGGRPLTTVTDMLLQANLLLSIKEYVRTFQGDEDALLTSLAPGVLNTVYANGVAASLNVNPDILENALIHSWCLLKSYQEGIAMANKKKARGEEYPDDEADDDAPRARPLSSRATPPPRMSYSDANVGEYIEDLGDLRNYVEEVRFPGLYRNFQYLTDVANGELQAQSYWSAITSHRQIHPEDKVTTYVEYIGGKLDNSSNPNTLVSRMCRMHRDAVDHGIRNGVPNGSVRLRASAIGGRYDPAYRPNHLIDYRQRLPARRLNEIANLLGLSVERLKNMTIWQHLRGTMVRVKNRGTLVAQANALGYDRIARQMTDSDTFTAAKLFVMLRLLDKQSAMHVFSADLLAYDKVAAIMQILLASGLSVPVSVRSRETNEWLIRFMQAKGSMAMTGQPIVTVNQTHTPRQSSCGHPIY